MRGCVLSQKSPSPKEKEPAEKHDPLLVLEGFIEAQKGKQTQ